MVLPDCFYENLRKQLFSPSVLSENQHIPEKWIQTIWEHQYVKTHDLNSLDGTIFHIIHPGQRNKEAGPDFKNAILRIGDNPPFTCDVEIDEEISFWKVHGHDQNPAFNNVALQVVYAPQKIKDFQPNRTISGKNILTFNLSDSLTIPSEKILEWAVASCAISAPSNIIGCCSSGITHMSEIQFNYLLEQAAMVRLNNKSELIKYAGMSYGWEKALYIYLMRALGYKQNTIQMQQLTECLLEALSIIGENFEDRKIDVCKYQSLLFGLAGMLPKNLVSNSEETKYQYLINLWDYWWRIQAEINHLVLPATIWKTGNCRPGNHPQRRIALAAYWFADKDFIAKIENWGKKDLPEIYAEKSLREILSPKIEDPFWERHYNLKAAASKKGLQLLGGEKVTEIAINVIIPWLWTRTELSDSKLRKLLKDRYLKWSIGNTNILTKNTLKRFFGNIPSPRLKYEYQQQGVLQIHHDFCQMTNLRCQDCPLGSALRIL